MINIFIFWDIGGIMGKMNETIKQNIENIEEGNPLTRSLRKLNKKFNLQRIYLKPTRRTYFREYMRRYRNKGS